ncbi:unnamed protein product [Caenorhabditis nigoni]
MDPGRFGEALRIVLRAWRDLPHEQFEEAFENALLRLHLGRQYNPNRYINTVPLYTGSNGLILSVSDVYNPNVKLVAKVHFVINTIRREKANYDNLQELSGFARFHDAFMMPLPEENILRSRFCYIMITEHVGESLPIIVKRSLPINQRNVVTLGYKLFLIIESMHAARLVHRDIQLKNVMLQRMPNEQLRMSLIGLDEALPLDPSPLNNSDVEGPYSSQFVDDGNPYVKFDDFTSGVYLILELCRIDIFEFDPVNSIIFDAMRIYDPKKRFHHHPEYYLNNENDWIGELNKEIQNQRVNGYSHDNLFQIFLQAIPNFVPTVSPFLEIEYILIGNDTIFLG